MTQNELLCATAKALEPNTVTKVVELDDCYVVSVCGDDGFYLMQPPYAVSKDGTKVSFYDVRSKESVDRLKNGKVVYSDPYFRKIARSAHNDGGPGSGNHGHKGVPGQVGGSAPSDSHSGSSAGPSTVSKFKSLIPKDSYFNSSSYNKAVEDFRGAIRKHDEAWKKYRELEKALKSESTPKPESEWDDNDIFEDLIGHRPMAYTENGKKIKSEMDKAFKDACVYDHEQTETGDKLREIKKKEHDKQVKNIHFQPPADASSDDYEGFTTKTTGTSAYDDYINGERNGGRIAEMSPAEYLQRCAYQVFEDATIESTLAAIDESNVKKYADMMKNGTKFDMPYLNFMSGQQEDGIEPLLLCKPESTRFPCWWSESDLLSTTVDQEVATSTTKVARVKSVDLPRKDPQTALHPSKSCQP